MPTYVNLDPTYFHESADIHDSYVVSYDIGSIVLIEHSDHYAAYLRITAAGNSDPITDTINWQLLGDGSTQYPHVVWEVVMRESHKTRDIRIAGSLTHTLRIGETAGDVTFHFTPGSADVTAELNGVLVTDLDTRGWLSVGHFIGSDSLGWFEITAVSADRVTISPTYPVCESGRSIPAYRLNTIDMPLGFANRLFDCDTIQPPSGTRISGNWNLDTEEQTNSTVIKQSSSSSNNGYGLYIKTDSSHSYELSNLIFVKFSQGVSATRGSQLTIHDITAVACNNGIYLGGGKYNECYSNTFHHNIFCGISFGYGADCVSRNSTFIGCAYGQKISGIRHKVYGHTFVRSTISDVYGYHSAAVRVHTCSSSLTKSALDLRYSYDCDIELHVESCTAEASYPVTLSSSKLTRISCTGATATYPVRIQALSGASVMDVVSKGFASLSTYIDAAGGGVVYNHTLIRSDGSKLISHVNGTIQSVASNTIAPGLVHTPSDEIWCVRPYLLYGSIPQYVDLKLGEVLLAGGVPTKASVWVRRFTENITAQFAAVPLSAVGGGSEVVAELTPTSSVIENDWQRIDLDFTPESGVMEFYVRVVAQPYQSSIPMYIDDFDVRQSVDT